MWTSSTRLIRALAEFIYPPFCAVCETSTSGPDGLICDTCWSSITPVTADHELLRQARTRLCTEEGCQDVVACYVFEEKGVIREIMHLLKYGGAPSIGRELGRRLGSLLSDRQVDGIIPVPLHRTKERERGYNQSTYIAAGVSAVVHSPVRTSFLVRRKFTETQTQLDAEGRRLNVVDAFEVPLSARPLVKGKRFLLVDDVITTGATTQAAARSLVSSGALSPVVCAVALAR